jgi:trans-aconitate methyltransferase
MDNMNFPEGDRIYDLYTGGYKPQVIRIALALDVFSPLAAGPAKAETVANICGCDTVGIGHLLDYLVSLNVLLKQGEDYSLSADAATFLVRGQKAYAGDLIMHLAGPAPFKSMQESILNGRPRSLDLEIDFAQDAWIESYRNNRISSSLEMWAKVGIIPDTVSRLNVLDIACGCAIKSLVLAQKSPKVELTCLDSPLVLESARDLAERWGVTTQVRFMSADLLTVELGEVQYNACLLGQITDYLTGEQNCNLFRRIQKALVDGGKLVLHVPMAAEKLNEENTFVSLLMWTNSGGRAYSFEEYRTWLKQAGFTAIHQHSERLLSAVC